MSTFGAILRTRLLPATLTAAGVALVTAGLLTYTDPATAGIGPSPSASPSINPTARPTAPASARPSASPAPSASSGPTFPADRVVTRVAVPALRIDIPVIRPPNDDYPLCDVAMFLVADQLGQPGQGRAIYLYSHARVGMFLPLLDASRVDDGKAMLGMVVQVWTSDDQLFLYEVTEVRRHQTDLDGALNADHEQLWLQTSEGPRDPTGRLTPKLQVVAEPLSNGPAADPADAHPSAKPRVCG